MAKHEPIVSAAELEALIEGWGAGSGHSVDRFFPLRFWVVFVVAGLFAARLLLMPELAAANLSADPEDIARLTKFLYFRGWFLAAWLLLGACSYIKNYYPGLVFFCMLLLGTANFVSDLFSVYAEQLARPTPYFTLQIILRIFILWLVFLCLKNVSRMPNVKDRLNIFLPFKRMP